MMFLFVFIVRYAVTHTHCSSPYTCIYIHTHTHTRTHVYNSSHAITADISVSEMSTAAEFFMSDGIIVTGQSTGSPADQSELAAVRTATSLPVLVGSGVTADNVHHYACADGLIVGSWFKQGGMWSNRVDKDRVSSFMNRIHSLSAIS